jgi:hypothetical protein
VLSIRILACLSICLPAFLVVSTQNCLPAHLLRQSVCLRRQNGRMLRVLDLEGIGISDMRGPVADFLMKVRTTSPGYGLRL